MLTGDAVFLPLAMIVGWQAGRGEWREAIRQLADLRSRLAAAEDALAEAHAASKRAEDASTLRATVSTPPGQAAGGD